MSFVTHPAAIWLRSALRSVGLVRPIAVLLLGNRRYEEAVDKALFEAIHLGDVVWDIGANVGYYTTKFANAVGAKGVVYAFEPSPQNLDRLRVALAGYENVRVVPVGLSSEPGRLKFVQGADELGATSKLVSSTRNAEAIEVEIKRGDDLVSKGEVSCPNVIKIDVEGHEHKVLSGLSDTLRQPSLRTLVIEVHFRLLKENGAGNAPKTIEAMLIQSGFNVRWIDPSHICATRLKSPPDH